MLRVRRSKSGLLMVEHDRTDNVSEIVVKGIDFRSPTTDPTEGSPLFIARINDLSQGIRQCPKQASNCLIVITLMVIDPVTSVTQRSPDKSTYFNTPPRARIRISTSKPELSQSGLTMPSWHVLLDPEQLHHSLMLHSGKRLG